MRLRDFGLACWSLFGFSGYARVDFRVDLMGAPFIIDVNPNPYLTPDSEDAAAAAEAGLSYQDLVGTIIESSLAKFRTQSPPRAVDETAYRSAAGPHENR